MSELNQYKVWIVDDDPQVLDALAQTFMLEGIATETFTSPMALLQALDYDSVAVVITDLNMPELDGLSLFKTIHKKDSELPVVLLTAFGDISIAVDAIRHGAYDFIEKPFNNEQVLDVVRRGAATRKLTVENRQLKKQIAQQQKEGPRILGNTPDIIQMRELLEQIKDLPADVLIHGDTGTGKELVARYLHDRSVRNKHNFVAINCGAIPENLIESELFGVEAGAYTGAMKQRAGKFEFANGGTLFLDEIESTPMDVQIKLLRVLEERKVTRVGGHQQTDLDIRVVAATKLDLKEMAEAGEFRLDLYYRLNLVNVFIPSLHSRAGDIPLLFNHFAKLAAANYHREFVPLDQNKLTLLVHYEWPGNVRELRNLAERYVLIGSDAAFKQEPKLNNQAAINTDSIGLVERVGLFEKRLIEEALSTNKGKINQTMAYLDLPRKTLYDKMKKYGIDRRLFTDSE